MQGFCAETGGAITLFAATWLGIPVSTTHTITGAIIGVGAARRGIAVRWGLAGNIVVAWVITHAGGSVDLGALLFRSGPHRLTLSRGTPLALPSAGSIFPLSNSIAFGGE